MAAIARVLDVDLEWLLSENGDGEVPKPRARGSSGAAVRLIGQEYVDAGDLPPNVARLLANAMLAEDMTPADWLEVAKWAERELRRATAPLANVDPKVAAGTLDVADKVRQVLQGDETTRPRGEQRRIPKRVRGNLGA